MTDDDIRELSAKLYGNAQRLHVAAAIGRLEGKPINVKVVAEESGLDVSRVQEQIAWFRNAGVLVPEFDSSSRTKDHRPVAISYWRNAASLFAELEDADDLV